jgi:hypothetical protein
MTETLELRSLPFRGATFTRPFARLSVGPVPARRPACAVVSAPARTSGAVSGTALLQSTARQIFLVVPFKAIGVFRALSPKAGGSARHAWLVAAMRMAVLAMGLLADLAPQNVDALGNGFQVSRVEAVPNAAKVIHNQIFGYRADEELVRVSVPARHAAIGTADVGVAIRAQSARPEPAFVRLARRRELSESRSEIHVRDVLRHRPKLIPVARGAKS